MTTAFRLQSNQLPCCLQIYNRITGKPIGFAGSLSAKSFLVFSHLPVLIGGVFEIGFHIPFDDGIRRIDVSAICQGCIRDDVSGDFESAFRLLESPPDYIALTEALQRYFSFRSLPASA